MGVRKRLIRLVHESFSLYRELTNYRTLIHHDLFFEHSTGPSIAQPDAACHICFDVFFVMAIGHDGASLVVILLAPTRCNGEGVCEQVRRATAPFWLGPSRYRLGQACLSTGRYVVIFCSCTHISEWFYSHSIYRQTHIHVVV